MMDKGCSCGESKGCGRCETDKPKVNIPCFICGKPKGQPPDRCPGHYEIPTEGFMEYVDNSATVTMYIYEELIDEDESGTETPREPHKGAG